MKCIYNGVFITDQNKRLRDCEGEIIGYTVTEDESHVTVSELLHGSDGNDSRMVMAFDLKHRNEAIEVAVLLLQALKIKPLIKNKA